MAEKEQFELVKLDDVCIQDNDSGVLYCMNNTSFASLCVLLNELSEENEQLKRKIEELIDELFGVTSALIYETSTTNIHKKIEEAKKEIYGD